MNLSDWDPDDTFGLTRDDDLLAKNLKRLDGLQSLLYADQRHAVLIVLQALDAGGKDGTIRHVMSGVNPQGCSVASFKAPTSEELRHDYLWRVHKQIPELGNIGIFNRSHYEDVLVVRVDRLAPKKVWSRRYKQINAFERILSENRVCILKFYLHIGKEEQQKRFQARITDPSKNWKISAADFAERPKWDRYIKAYEAALTKCSTAQAPWYVIPANKKWFRNFAVSEIIIRNMEQLRLRYPPPSVDLSKIQIT